IADYHKIDPTKKAICTPSVFFLEMNKELYKFCEKNSSESSLFLTAIYVLLNYEKREIKFSIAGHSRPIIISANGDIKEIGASGPILGAFEVFNYDEDKFRDSCMKLEEGDLFFICSDGLMDEEDINGIPFKNKLYHEVLPLTVNKKVHDAYEIVKNAYEEHRGNKKPDDDVSFIFLGSRPVSLYDTYTFRPGKELMEEAINSLVNVHQYVTKEELEKKWEYIPELDESFDVVDDLDIVYQPILKNLEKDGWSPSRIKSINLAFNEMLMNAIIHGNLASDRHKVIVKHIVYNDVLEIGVEDKGAGFKGNMLNQIINEENIFLGYGRGMHILKEYADNVCFSDSGSTCWTLFSKG
ncbi:MAG: SpoIIE family protein phosphatase, partial [Nitrospinae bacterium]|nr:SpoIIE family protein phosphatase [Nitrospinota bacterium]